MIHYGIDILIHQHIPHGAKKLFLGDQRMSLEHNHGETADYAHTYYENSDTVDYNGNATINADLSKQWRGGNVLRGYDAVIDSGTGEHVANLFAMLYNVLNALKVGGVAIHANPHKDHFPGHSTHGCHCYHWFTQAFWEEYAKLAKLELVLTDVQYAYHNRETGGEVIAIYKKNPESSLLANKKNKEAFKVLYSHYIFGDPKDRKG